MADFEATQKQTELFNAIFKRGKTQIVYGGAIRGGKSYGVMAIFILLALKYPKSRWALVRSDLPTIRRNLVPVFNKVVNQLNLSGIVSKVNQQSWEATFANGSKFIFFPESYNIDKDLDRWKGLEVNGFFIDEVNELQEASYFKAVERAGAWVVPEGEQPPPLIVMTTNPSRNWVKERFYDPYKGGTLPDYIEFIVSTPFDNPYLPESFLKSLEQLKEQNPAHYKRFVEGDWEVIDGGAFSESDFKRIQHIDEEALSNRIIVADIAYTKKKHSDYCAIGIASITYDGTKILEKALVRRMEPSESVPALLRYAREYPECTLYVEADHSYIELLRQALDRENLSRRVVQLSPGGASKVDRILSMKANLPFWRFTNDVQVVINQCLDWSVEMHNKVPDDSIDMLSYCDSILRYDGAKREKWDKFKTPPTDPMKKKLWDAMKKGNKTRPTPRKF